MEYEYLFLRLGGLLTILLFGYWIVKITLFARTKQEEILDYSPVEKTILESSLKAYGRNTSSIVHMYGELLHLKPFGPGSGKDPNSLIGYLSFDKSNIMVTDPLCAAKDTKEAILEFTKFTQNKNKTSLLFPVDQITARQAAELGYGIFKVGNEPVFNLKTYSSTTLDKKILSAISQVSQKGVRIENPSFQEIKLAGLETELNAVLAEWLITRRSEKMRLLLEVSPFKFSEEKKYFIARSKDKIEAFLACSPIYGRNGYFLHDLIRRPTAMNGVSEALIVFALTKFKDEGYDFASLGTAPLSGLDSPNSNPRHTLLNKLLVRIFNSHETFMRFKSLYNFKKKFKPSAEESTFLAFYPPNLNIRDMLTVAGLFSSKGPLGELIFKLKRWLEGDQLPHPLIKLLRPNIATLPRPVPFSIFEFVARLRFTFVLFFLNVYTYLNTTNFVGDLNLDTIKKYGFNYSDFLAHKWFILLTSNFLHFSYSHLFGNMAMLFLFSGTLEFIAGSSIAAVSFIIGMNANVPTGMILFPLLKTLNPTAWQHVVSYMDVGASLGIMCSYGVLIQFFKNRNKLLILSCLIMVALGVFEREYFGLDHTVAIIMGSIIGHVYLHQRFQAQGFQRFFASSDHPNQYNSPLPSRKRPR